MRTMTECWFTIEANRLALPGAPAIEQTDLVLAEDGQTVVAYCYLADDGLLMSSFDLPSTGTVFDKERFEQAFANISNTLH